MAQSIRELILLSLESQLAAITTVNGYDINVATIERARQSFALTDLPAVSIFDAGEEFTHNYNLQQVVMVVNVDMHSDALNENRSIHANKMLACLKKAIGSADVTHGGKAERTALSASAIRYPENDDDTKVSVSVNIRITFEEIEGDPYSTPA